MLLRKFSWLYRCANWRCREFFAAENIKDIKSFRAKKFGFNISGWLLRSFLNASQCTARSFRLVTDMKNKNRENPLRLMQNGSDEPLILWLAENPASKLGNFQPVTASPYRVLHQAQGDKQKKQLFCWKHYGIFCMKIGKQHSVCSGKSGTILKG